MRERAVVHREFDQVPIHEETFQPHWPRHPIFEVLDPRAYRATVAELRRLKPDLVHINNTSGASLAPFVACWRLGVPVVLTLHDLWLLCPNNMLYREDGSMCDPAGETSHCRHCFRRYDFWAAVPWRRALFARLVSNVRVLISGSRKLIDLHVAAGYDRARFRHIPNGIRPSGLPVTDDRVLASMRGRGRFHTLLYAGAIAEIKGVQTLTAALPQLIRDVEHLRVLVAGAGEERLAADLRRYTPVVQLLGRVPFQQMRGLFATADLLVLPTVCYENASLSQAESLTSGTPVLGAAIGGIPEFIEERRTGYLFPPGDAAALAARVVEHLSRPAWERREMRRCCVEYARTALSIDLNLDRIEQVYAEVLA